jgi:tRNA(Ile)-lysidine synthase
MTPRQTTLQDLPPRWAHFCLDVQRFICAEIGKDISGAVLLLGLSGGADSTALLRIFCYLAPGLHLTVEAVHLDHGLREESTEDAAFCRNLCATLGVRLHEKVVNVRALAQKSGHGLEETARTLRYSVYAQCMRSLNADWLVLGHHGDDLAEDVLMRLIRGTGWPELAGMPTVDPCRRLLRPLLRNTKVELTEFLHCIGQNWREDASNENLQFFRNRIRHTIMPLVSRENPSFVTGLNALRHIARADAEHFAALLASIVPKTPDSSGELSLPVPALRELDMALRLRAFKLAVERMEKGQPLAKNLFLLDQAFYSKRTGKTIQFPGNLYARIERDFVRFFPKPEPSDKALGKTT